MARRLGAADQTPLIIVHRGLWRRHPENSLPAIRAARAFDMVEIDLRLSADGIPVVMHDESCLRTTGHDVVVADTLASDLASVPFPNGEAFVPMLSDALGAGGDDLLFDLDVKEPDDLEDVARFMSGRPERTRCYLKMDVDTSDDISALLDLEKRSNLCVIAKHKLGPDSLDLMLEMKSRGVAAAEVWFPDLDLLGEALRVGPPLTTYTLRDVHCAGLSDEIAVDDPAQVWGPLVSLGLRGIMTDEAERLSGFLQTS